MSDTVQQSGTVTPGHAASWTTDGVLQDAGPATAGGLSELGITKAGGIAFAINSAPTGEANIQYGIGVNANGTILVYANSYNGAPAPVVGYSINGTITPITGVSLVAGAGISFTPSPILEYGTISLAAMAAGSLFGNAGTVSAVGTNIAIGAGLSLSTSGTLFGTVTAGTTTTIVAGTGLQGGSITASGTISLGTIAAGEMMGNSSGSGAIPTGVVVGSNLLLSSGTLNLGTVAANSLFGNSGTAGAQGSSVAIGANLAVSGGTISATVPSYSAGQGIQINGGTIALASLSATSLLGNSSNVGAIPGAIAIGGNVVLSSGILSLSNSPVFTGSVGVGAASAAGQAPQWGQVLGGNGATLINVTGSRAFGTNYVNTFGKPILVYVFGYSTTAYALIATVDSTAVVYSSYQPVGSYSAGITFPVESGGTYSVSPTNGTGTVELWTEFR